MNRVAFVFYSAPHGSSAGREGLDALLATSALNEKIGVFFIGDGVFQILAGQRPDAVLARDYIVTFKVLLFYHIDDILICATSMQERGLPADTTMLMLDAEPLSSHELRERLSSYDIVLTF